MTPLEQAIMLLAVALLGGIASAALVEWRRIRKRQHDIENWCAAVIIWLKLTQPEHADSMPVFPRSKNGD